MTPKELKTWRAKAGLTQAKVAQLFDISRRQYQRYEAGENKIPKLVAMVVKWERLGDE